MGFWKGSIYPFQFLLNPSHYISRPGVPSNSYCCRDQVTSTLCPTLVTWSSVTQKKPFWEICLTWWIKLTPRDQSKMNCPSPYVDFIKNRRSVRNYHQKAISLDVIDSILETARWAPSAHNSQPWRFFILIKKSVRQNLIKEMARCFYQDLVNDGVT